MATEYDIVNAFQKIEEELILSMKRNLSRHIKEEKEEGFNWTMWQAEKLKSLKAFRQQNPELFKKYFSTTNKDIKEVIQKAFENGQTTQEATILESIRNSNYTGKNKNINKLIHIYKTSKSKRIRKKAQKRIDGIVNKNNSNFFGINQQKLKSLIEEAQNGTKKASSSILRYTDDQYRKIIFNAQVYANTGAGTPEKAIDMATKDFLAAGINSIQYSNGARVNIASYAAMAIKTATRRAYIQGEGSKRDEWGIHTVLVPNRGGGCPFCCKYQGKVFIDDVYSSGSEKESNESDYPLLSTAISGGLLHPNCKDTVVTYFPGVNSESDVPSKSEIAEKVQNYNREQKINYIDRNIEKYKRLELGSIDDENVEKYHNKRVAWQEYKKRFKQDNETSYKEIEEYRQLKEIVGSKNIETFDKFRKMVYNNSEEYMQIKEYTNLYRKKEIPNDFKFDIYRSNLANIDWTAVGFNPKRLNDHFEKHASELGIKTEKEYEKFAKDIINKKENKNVVGFRSKDGHVFKYNTKENIFAVAKPNGIIETCFKPSRGINYWKDQVKKYGD
jgi:hypothetical protein